MNESRNLLEAVIVDELRTVTMDQCTESQTILETRGERREGGREGERKKRERNTHSSIPLPV